MAKDEQDKPKVGAGSLGAWMRQGLRELRAALYPESNVAQQTEYGMYGTKTPGEIAADRRSDVRDLSDGPSLEDRIQQMGPSRDDPERDNRDLDKE